MVKGTFCLSGDTSPALACSLAMVWRRDRDSAILKAMASDAAPRYIAADFATLTPTPCPCGFARRALADVDDFPGTLHRTEITLDARRHYHRLHTEVYYFLECQAGAEMELDADRLPVRPGMCVLIPAGVRHRAIGRMTVMILSLPKFDPDDEWFD
jgi:hypothetical protein